MHWIRFTILLLVVTLLNAGNLLNVISVSSLNITPDLLLILLVFFASSCAGPEAIIASFAIGFARDISGQVMGPAFVSFGVFGSLIWLLCRTAGDASIAIQRTGQKSMYSFWSRKSRADLKNAFVQNITFKTLILRSVGIFIIALLAIGMADVLTIFKSSGMTENFSALDEKFLTAKQSMSNIKLIIVFTAVYSGLAGAILWPLLTIISGWLQKRKM